MYTIMTVKGKIVWWLRAQIQKPDLENMTPIESDPDRIEIQFSSHITLGK